MGHFHHFCSTFSVKYSFFTGELTCFYDIFQNSIFGRCVSDFVESAVCKPRDVRKMLEAIKLLNNLIDGGKRMSLKLFFFQLISKI